MTYKKLFKNKWLRFVSCLATFIFMVFNFQVVCAQETRARVNERVELGFLHRLFESVDGDRVQWVEKFCDLALSLKGEDYARFVRLARRESVAITLEEDMNISKIGRGHFYAYTFSDDRPRAFQCLEHAGDNATPDVQFELFWLIRGSPQVAPSNPYKWLKKSAQGGEPRAQYRLAREIRFSGLITGNAPADVPREVVEEGTLERYHYWLKSSAEGGFPTAQLELGQVYAGYSGREYGRLLSVPEGLKWLERAATQNKDEDARDDAAARLGEIYFTGKKVPQDYKQALRWFSVIDKWRLKQPCSNVGWVNSLLRQMYQDGLGVEKDQDKVKFYSVYCVRA